MTAYIHTLCGFDELGSDSEKYSYNLCPALKPGLLFLYDSFFVGQTQTIGKPFRLLTTVAFTIKFLKNCIGITVEQGSHAFLQRQLSYHEIRPLHICLGFSRRIFRTIRFHCRSEILSSVAQLIGDVPFFSYIDTVIPRILILIKAINFVLFTCNRAVERLAHFQSHLCQQKLDQQMSNIIL